MYTDWSIIPMTGYLRTLKNAMQESEPSLANGDTNILNLRCNGYRPSDWKNARPWELGIADLFSQLRWRETLFEKTTMEVLFQQRAKDFFAATAHRSTHSVLVVCQSRKAVPERTSVRRIFVQNWPSLIGGESFWKPKDCFLCIRWVRWWCLLFAFRLTQ